MRSRLPLALAAAGAAVLPAAPADAGGACRVEITEASVTTVHTDHACFDPVVNRVPVGTTVTWVAATDEKHNLVGGPTLIGAHDLVPGRPVRIAFGKAGTFPYACTLHPGMTGVVIVGEEPKPAAPAPTSPPAPVTLTATDEGWTDSPAAVGGAGAGALALGALGGFAAARRRRG